MKASFVALSYQDQLAPPASITALRFLINVFHHNDSTLPLIYRLIFSTESFSSAPSASSGLTHAMQIVAYHATSENKLVRSVLC